MTQVTVRTGLADELSVGKIWVKVGVDCWETVVRVCRGGVFVIAYVMRTYSTKYECFCFLEATPVHYE